jgi:hypothetical protein
LFFSTKFAKIIISRLEVKKNFFKGEKAIPVGFFTKSNSSEENIYRNRRLKIHFQRCASQNKTRKIKTKSNSTSMF